MLDANARAYRDAWAYTYDDRYDVPYGYCIAVINGRRHGHTVIDADPDEQPHSNTFTAPAD